MAENILKQVQIPEEVLKAENITFDNTGVDLSSDNAQNAITEVLAKLKNTTTELQKLINTAYANANKYTDQEIAELIGGAPTTLDTLKEITDAMAANDTVVQALNNAIGSKANASDLTNFMNRLSWHGNLTQNIDTAPGNIVCGAYWVTSIAGDSRYVEGTHAFTNTYYYLFIFPSTDGVQFAVNWNTGEIKSRCYVNSSWQFWTADKLPITGGKITGPLYIGDFLTLWSDNEGGNIDIISPSSVGGRWCIDAYNGNLRFFHYNSSGVIDRTFTLATNGTIDCIASNVSGLVAIQNGGTGATTAAAAMQNLAPSHHASPAYVYSMGIGGYGGGSGYSTIAELKAAMALNNVNNTADNTKSVNYANSAGSANSVAWGNITGKPSTYTPASHTHNYLPLSGGTLTGPLTANKTIYMNKELYVYSGGYITFEGACQILSNSLIYLAPNGSVAAAGNSGSYRFSDAKLLPTMDNVQILGDSSYRWKQIYAATSTISTSDRNLKENIKELTQAHKEFFMKLVPVSFTFIDGDSGRTHIGFISQDVEQAMYECGLTDLDFAGFCKDVKTIINVTYGEVLDEDGIAVINEDGEPVMKLIDEEVPLLDEDGNEQYIYSLRYEEFIALNTYVIQDTILELEDTKNRVNAIEERLAEIGA